MGSTLEADWGSNSVPIHTVLLPAAPVRPVPVLGDQPLQPHAAGGPEQVGADGAGLERRNEDAVRASGEQACEVGLAQAERKVSENMRLGSSSIGVLTPNFAECALQELVQVPEQLPCDRPHEGDNRRKWD
ncbi:hypothetical protein GCM10010987_40830 [Bradyrhizobium guangdongense]|uniref:Uncharacterized protein n=1 Tax=Bradyrhizobium guangdongense TaxID=1325090 RepID=A0AA88B9D4_9BRAD|nr:hypothetical protein GCM10010987_40830 [Bradyrhizobium guangdongense]